MSRLVIVLPLSPLAVGVRFSVADWPLHITVLPPFLTAVPAAEIDQVMAATAAEQESFTAVAGEDALFGRRHDVPVTLVVHNERLIAVHRALVDAVRPFAARPDEPAFTGGGFRPHITVKNGRRVNEGDLLSLTQLALVDMLPRASAQGRTVLSTASFTPPE